MKLKTIAVAVAFAVSAPYALADMAAAEKWVDSEFKPSTLSRQQPRA